MTIREHVISLLTNNGPMTFAALADRIQPRSTASLRVTICKMVDEGILAPVDESIRYARAYRLV